MTGSSTRGGRCRCCDVCHRRTTEMWQHRVTGFGYCDDCRYGFDADDLIRVV